MPNLIIARRLSAREEPGSVAAPWPKAASATTPARPRHTQPKNTTPERSVSDADPQEEFAGSSRWRIALAVVAPIAVAVGAPRYICRHARADGLHWR